MHLGISRIRSAGRTSGSIEITLPPALQVFTGLSCRVTVRDGVQPEIVLLPDVVRARALIEALWQKLAPALGSTEQADDFTTNLLIHTLLPARHRQHSLSIAYADAMTLSAGGAERSAQDLEALARILSALTAAIGRSLGLEPAFSDGFGDAVAFVVTRVTAGFSNDFERSMATALARQAAADQPSTISLFDDEFWLDYEPALRRIRDQFFAWQRDPDAFRAARQQWYRALQCEGVPEHAGAGIASHDL